MSGPNGKFSLTGVLTGDYILKVSYLGYSTKEIEFQITKKTLILI